MEVCQQQQAKERLASQPEVGQIYKLQSLPLPFPQTFNTATVNFALPALGSVTFFSQQFAPRLCPYSSLKA
jgi:hypothetical protein